jgi:hypothetical protein
MRIFFAAIAAGYPEGLVPLSPLESLAEWQIFDAACTYRGADFQLGMLPAALLFGSE